MQLRRGWVGPSFNVNYGKSPNRLRTLLIACLTSKNRHELGIALLECYNSNYAHRYASLHNNNRSFISRWVS
jgi:hypothetical protein